MTTTPINDTSITSGFNVDELTEGSLTGKGVLDVLLQTLRLHLDREFTSGRITGTAYATVYAQAITAFLAQAAQYALSKAKLPLELQLLEKQITLAQKQQDQITAAIRQSDYVTDFQLPSEVANKDKSTELLNYELANIKPAELAGIGADTSLKAYELTDIKPTQKAQIVAETSHVTKQELNTVQQTLNLGSQQAQIETETDRILYEITNKLPEEVQLIKLNQDQLIAQNNKIATDTVVTIKQGHLTDAQTCQVTAQTNQVNAEVALKLPAEVANLTKQGLLVDSQKVVADKQALSIAAETSKINAEVALKLPEEIEILKRNQTQLTAQTGEIDYRVSTLLPSQTAQNTAQTAQITYTTSYVLPSQVSLTNAQTGSATAQTALYNQKTVTELAQTTTTPASGSVMGVQNDLMATQKASYLRDAEQKAAKMLIDTWNIRMNTHPTDTNFNATNRLRDEDIGSAVDKMLDGIGVV